MVLLLGAWNHCDFFPELYSRPQPGPVIGGAGGGGGKASVFGASLRAGFTSASAVKQIALIFLGNLGHDQQKKKSLYLCSDSML